MLTTFTYKCKSAPVPDTFSDISGSKEFEHLGVQSTSKWKKCSNSHQFYVIIFQFSVTADSWRKLSET